MTATSQHAGHAVYTPRVLAIYDAWVLGISNRWIWKCPTSKLLAHYNQHVSANHLDVGVGTGYYLDRCRFPSPTPHVALLDINEHALAVASRRIARHRPAVFHGDIRQPLDLGGAKFDSIGLNFVLHCLPGGVEEKSAVIANVARHLNSDGVLFGSTLLGAGVTRSRTARWLMARYRQHGIFDNADEDQASVEAILRSQFQNVEMAAMGCAALFVGRQPKR